MVEENIKTLLLALSRFSGTLALWREKRPSDVSTEVVDSQEDGYGQKD